MFGTNKSHTVFVGTYNNVGTPPDFLEIIFQLLPRSLGGGYFALELFAVLEPRVGQLFVPLLLS